jgi:hypothetical protein
VEKAWVVIDMLNNSNKTAHSYCCGSLEYQIESVLCPVGYSKQWREYSIRDFKSTSVSLMMFCPNCGTKLPSSLRDQWFDILEKEYGLEGPIEEDKKQIPKEFLTDDWWKKRGLAEEKKESASLVYLPDKPVRYLF